MICCFVNTHREENAQDLVKYFDTEIEKAILFGCSVFMAGKNTYEEKLFAQRVQKAAKYYADGEVVFVGLNMSDKKLYDFFVKKSDFDI